MPHQPPRWPQVMRDPASLREDITAYLEAENRYTEAVLGHTRPLQQQLLDEFRGRIQEADAITCSSEPTPAAPRISGWSRRRWRGPTRQAGVTSCRTGPAR